MAHIIIMYVYIIYTYPLLPISPRMERRARNTAGKEKRQGDTIARSNNPATLFGPTVRECGQQVSDRSRDTAETPVAAFLPSGAVMDLRMPIPPSASRL